MPADPAGLGDKMSGLTCAGTWVTGTGTDGAPREVYLYHVVDNAWSMAEYGSQAVVWQTAVNPVVALELIDSGAWSGSRRPRPRGAAAAAVPRPADRLRLPLGPAKSAPPPEPLGAASNRDQMSERICRSTLVVFATGSAWRQSCSMTSR